MTSQRTFADNNTARSIGLLARCIHDSASIDEGQSDIFIKAPLDVIKLLVDAHPVGVTWAFPGGKESIIAHTDDPEKSEHLLNRAIEYLRSAESTLFDKDKRKAIHTFFFNHLHHEGIVARMLQEFPDLVKKNLSRDT